MRRLVFAAILLCCACGTDRTRTLPTGTTLDGSTIRDGETTDAGTPDSGTRDAGTPDAGTPDAGTPDAGTPDAGTPDAGPMGCDQNPNGCAKHELIGAPPRCTCLNICETGYVYNLQTQMCDPI